MTVIQVLVMLYQLSCVRGGSEGDGGCRKSGLDWFVSDSSSQASAMIKRVAELATDASAQHDVQVPPPHTPSPSYPFAFIPYHTIISPFYTIVFLSLPL